MLVCVEVITMTTADLIMYNKSVFCVLRQLTCRELGGGAWPGSDERFLTQTHVLIFILLVILGTEYTTHISTPSPYYTHTITKDTPHSQPCKSHFTLTTHTTTPTNSQHHIPYTPHPTTYPSGGHGSGTRLGGIFSVFLDSGWVQRPPLLV